MADEWDEFQDAWDEFEDAPAASAPAGGRRGRGGVDLAAQRSRERQQRDLRRQQVRDTFSMEHAPETSIAAGEQLAMLGSGAVAELAGLAAEAGARGRRLLGLSGANDPDPKTQRDQITELFTYQPRTPGAAEQLGEIAAPVARLLGPVVDAFGAEKRRFEGVPVLQDLYAAPFLAGEALLATGGQIGSGPRALLRAERAGREAVQLANRQLTDPGLLAAHYGLEVSPNELQAVRPGADVPGGAKFAESATSTVTAESRARANAPRLNRIAARAMGVPETDLLTPEVFQRAKEPHFAVRQEGKRFPQTPTSQEFMQDIERLRNGEWDPDAARTIHEVISRHEVLGSSDDLVDRITSLRDQASKRMRSDGQMAYKDYEIGTALRRLADAMEDELGRRAAAAGDVSYQGRLRESRRALAKIYAVEDATRADHLDVSRLAEAQKRGAPFTEDLAVLAHIGERLPRSVAHTQRVPAAPAGVETSAAGPMGAANRFLQNAIRRLIGERVVSNFNERLQQQAAGLDPARVLPDAFRPRYDYPSPMGPNDGPPAPPLVPPTLLRPLDEFERGGFDAPPQPLEIQPSGLSQVASPDLPEGLSLDAPDINAMLAPRTTLTDAELTELLLEPGDFASLRRELGQQPLLGEGLGEAPGMQVPPRGINEAQLGGRTPRGFELLEDDTPPPLGPLLGPGDEFPPPSAPGAGGGALFADELSSASATSAGASPDISHLLDPDGGLTLYRRTGRERDPYVAQNDAQRTFWSTGEADPTYGPRQGQVTIPPHMLRELDIIGDEGELYRRFGMDPNDPATYSDAGRLELLRRYNASPEARGGLLFSQQGVSGPEWQGAFTDDFVRRLRGL